MQPFDLSLWLQDKSRKVVTKTGEEVKIIDTNAPDENNPIIGYIYHKQKWNGPWSWHIDGVYKVGGDDMDLFFEDEEEELTEFEKRLKEVLYEHATTNTSSEEKARQYAPELLDLARKELEANYYTKVLDDRVVFKSDLHDRDMQGAYELGKQDALKDLPKWEYFTTIPDYSKSGTYLTLLDGFLYNIITHKRIGLNQLEKLPKAE